MIVELKKVKAQKRNRKRAMDWRAAQTSGIVPLPISMSTNAPLPAVPATGGP
jgi:hypothetical protein